MNLEEERKRGRAAAQVLADPLIAEAFATLQAKLTTAWAATTDTQERERERLWLSLRLLGSVKAHFTSLVTTGKMAEMQITEIEEQAKRARARKRGTNG